MTEHQGPTRRPPLRVHPDIIAGRAHYRPVDPPAPTVIRESTPRDVAKTRTIELHLAREALAAAKSPRARAAAEKAVADADAAREAAVQAWLGPKQRKDHTRKTGGTTP